MDSNKLSSEDVHDLMDKIKTICDDDESDLHTLSRAVEYSEKIGDSIDVGTNISLPEVLIFVSYMYVLKTRIKSYDE